MRAARSGAALFALALACVVPACADAQVRANPDARVFQDSPLTRRELPLLYSVRPSGESSAAQRPLPPIDARLVARLRRATDLRTAGLFAAARDTALAVAKLAPGHPLVELELARLDLALNHAGDAAERLRRLRAATRDTVIGARELSQACERLARTREAAAVAIACWSVSPGEGAWALSQVLRFAPLEPRGVGADLQAAVTARPWRTDLLRGWALLLARQGRAAEAVARLAEADARTRSVALRTGFADDLTLSGVGADSLAAAEALASVAADSSASAFARAGAARRALDLTAAPAARAALVPRLARALANVPASTLGATLAIDLAHELSLAGRGDDARALLARAARGPGATREVELERLLAVLREGPPARALPGLDSLARIWSGARFMRAEALFFAGELDSARAAYTRAAKELPAEQAMTAFDRAYQLEDDPGAPAQRVLGDVAYARWRGDAPRALALADSLWAALPRTSRSYARAALTAADLRIAGRDWRGALAPLLAVADSLPADRLAPVASQRAGEAWLALGDARAARERFEDCLARYPRAWNAPEVRRQLEPLRRSRP